jgi:hypothetical protein
MHFKIKKVSYGKGWACYAYDHGKLTFLPEKSWPSGLNPGLSLTEARNVIHSITSHKRIQAEETKRLAVINRVKREALVKSA